MSNSEQKTIGWLKMDTESGKMLNQPEIMSVVNVKMNPQRL
jgi:hypothetical protein